jgi:hypothetical protein
MMFESVKKASSGSWKKVVWVDRYGFVCILRAGLLDLLIAGMLALGPFLY